MAKSDRQTCDNRGQVEFLGQCEARTGDGVSHKSGGVLTSYVDGGNARLKNFKASAEHPGFRAARARLHTPKTRRASTVWKIPTLPYSKPTPATSRKPLRTDSGTSAEISPPSKATSLTIRELK